MSEEERKGFLLWYENEKFELFDNRCVFETNSQDDVTVLRQACGVFSRDFMQIGNIEMFLEAITIAPACNKILRRQLLKPDTIGLIPTGGYTCNNKYNKNVMMWPMHMEQMDGVKIKQVATDASTGFPNYVNSV